MIHDLVIVLVTAIAVSVAWTLFYTKALAKISQLMRKSYEGEKADAKKEGWQFGYDYGRSETYRERAGNDVH